MRQVASVLKMARSGPVWAAMAFFALGVPSLIHAQSYLRTLTVELGPWPMTTPEPVINLQNYGITGDQVVGLSAVIRSDLGEVYQIARLPDTKTDYDPSEYPGGSVRIEYNAAYNRWEVLVEAAYQYFGAPENISRFDDPTVNRGSVTIRYLSNTPGAEPMPQDNSLFFRIGGWDMPVYFGHTVAIPGLGVATSSIVEFQTTIYSNPSGGQIEADLLKRPSGAQTSGKRDRGGRENIDASKNLQQYVPNLPPGRSPSIAKPYPGYGRFIASAYSGTSNNRGWAMVRYNPAGNNSNLSQPFAVQTKTLSIGPWDATDATTPLTKTLSSQGVAADRVLYYDALLITDPDVFSTGKQYRDYHGMIWGGAGTVISGIQDKIFFHTSFDRHSGLLDPTQNRGFMNIFQRAADCADGVGTLLTNAANVGGRPLTAMTWNGSGYVSTANYQGCNGQRNGLYVIENTGNDIWNTTDQFRFVYKPNSGPRTITVKVEQLENTDPWARAGLMIREGTANNGKYAGVFVTPGNGLIFQSRLSPYSPLNNTVDLGRYSGLKAPIWLRLNSSGSSVSAAYSLNGVNFYSFGQVYSISFSNYNVGLAAAGHSNYPNTSVYSNLQGF